MRPNFNWSNWLYETADIGDIINVLVLKKLYICEIAGFATSGMGPFLPIIVAKNYGGVFDVEDKGKPSKWKALVLSVSDLEENAVYNESIMDKK